MWRYLYIYNKHCNVSIVEYVLLLTLKILVDQDNFSGDKIRHLKIYINMFK